MEVLYRYISGGVAALMALFAPVIPLVWCVTAFILFDFITGVAASYCEARRNNREWYFESRTAWHTVQKLGFTIVALCMAYLIDALMLDFMQLHLTKLFAGFVCGVEMWSFLENACRISSSPLLKYIRRYVRQTIENKIKDESWNREL